MKEVHFDFIVGYSVIRCSVKVQNKFRSVSDY